MWPSGGIGTGMLPELPVSILDLKKQEPVVFGGLKSAKVSVWLQGILSGDYQYRSGSWNLG